MFITSLGTKVKSEMSLIQPCLYLASASPRRHELLNQIGIRHHVLYVPSSVDEDEPILPQESALNYVRRTAHEKLQQALLWRAEQRDLNLTWPILCADTTVELAGEILAKPCDLEHAAQMLMALSGNMHQVHTAACIAYQGQIFHALSTSQIWFRTLTSTEIDQYCQSQEPLGKAGAYGIQGKAAIFIERLVGSYSGVMGLDLYQTHQLYLQAGLQYPSAHF